MRDATIFAICIACIVLAVAIMHKATGVFL